MREMFNIAQVREGLTHAATNFQATRHTSRLSVFRLQSAEGMSIGAIARDWGLSRQLVSRMIKEHQTDRAAAT